MKQILVLLLFISCSVSNAQTYFQQQVDYDIDVHLNDQTHQLDGTEIITYTNNSPTTLTEIYFHLWGNAYQDKNSAFGKQKLRNLEKDFFFAKKEDLGGYSEVSFSTNNTENRWEYSKKHKDIAIVQLTNPLKTGESVEFIIHFSLKIPIPFSRFNRIDQSYNITQWYPKPAVYDRTGWHPIPYLDFGEFYSEFGNFEVNISLPADYVVAATGTLTTPSEIENLNQLVIQTDSLIEYGTPVQRDSNQQIKTLHYTAKNVHDFAWFANKKFLVRKKDFTLPSGAPKTAWAFFSQKRLEAWKDADELVAKAILTQSEWIGDYPYPQATAVMGETPVGGGMEYPMITNIEPNAKGRELEVVIRHEVGHNWFYGILGTNERQFAWMDEGINSFYDDRYERKYFSQKNKKKKKRFFDLMGDSSEDQLLSDINTSTKDEANPSTDAEKMNTLQYVWAAYNKPAKVFRYLEVYIGKQFDDIMKKYYQTWKFKHPYPSDLRKLFETETGKDLSWAFDDLLNSKKRMDYAILSVKEEDGKIEIKIGNLGEINAPFPVELIKDGQSIQKHWMEGFADVDILTIDSVDYDKIVIDYNNQSLDVNRRNNIYFAKFHKFKPITFKPIFSLGNTRENRIHYFPLAGWNTHDQSMVGMAFYNIPFPSKTMDYLLAPMYSFHTKQLNGFARFRYNVYPNQGISKISMGFKVKTFTEFLSEDPKAMLRYRKFNPFIRVDLRKNPISYLQHSFVANISHFSNQVEGSIVGNTPDYRVTTIAYEINNTHPILPTYAHLEFENNTHFAKNNKISLEVKQNWYYSPRSNITLRLFAGSGIGRLTVNQKYSGFFLYGNSFSDYTYDDITRFRNEESNYVVERHGGFRNINVSVFEKLGYAESIVATNLTVALPKRFRFIKPYFDFAILGGVWSSPTVHWSTGISLGIDDYINVYFPITGTNTVAGDYKKQISFSINLKKLDPWNIDYKKMILNMIN